MNNYGSLMMHMRITTQMRHRVTVLCSASNPSYPLTEYQLTLSVLWPEWLKSIAPMTTQEYRLNNWHLCPRNCWPRVWWLQESTCLYGTAKLILLFGRSRGNWSVLWLMYPRMHDTIRQILDNLQRSNYGLALFLINDSLWRSYIRKIYFSH